MTKSIISVLLVLFITVQAFADEQPLPPHKRVTGLYRVYGGGLGDPVIASAKDAKIMLSVDGKIAKEMFDAMGPDVSDECLEGTKTRVRKKDNDKLFCMRSQQGEYSCNFGFDLKTGKSVGGIVC